MNSIFLQTLLLVLELSTSNATPPRYTAPPPVIQAFKATHPIQWQRGLSVTEDLLKNPRNKFYSPIIFTPEDIKNPSNQITYATMGDITVLNNTTFIYKNKSISLHQGKLIYSGQTIKLINQDLVEPEENNFYYTRSYSKNTHIYWHGSSYNASYYDYSHSKKGVSYFNIIPGGHAGDKHRAVCYEAGYRLNYYSHWHPSILVIYTDKTAVAYRFDGYDDGDGGCDSIRTDGKGTFLVPRIQTTQSTSFDHMDDTPHTLESVHKRLVWYICTMDGCQHYIDPRPVYYGNIQLYVGHVTDWRTVPGAPPFIYDNPPLIGNWGNRYIGPLLVDWFNSPICKFASALGILSSVC